MHGVSEHACSDEVQVVETFSQCHHKLSFPGLHSPGRSYFTDLALSSNHLHRAKYARKEVSIPVTNVAHA